LSFLRVVGAASLLIRYFVRCSVKGKIVTQLAPLKKWYNAEDYHQDYLFENPNGEFAWFSGTLK
jgi:peptide methionine sulfoxide reductase MsrA